MVCAGVPLAACSEKSWKSLSAMREEAGGITGIEPRFETTASGP